MTEGVEAVRELWPLLSVRSITESIRFYRDQLGFEVVGAAEAEGALYWCRLRRGGACLMLQQFEGVAVDQGGDDALYVICEDADDIFTELKAKGMDVERPVVAEYGMKQLFVPEPDGRTLVFESPTADWAG
ncbi:MAG: VOC family protein [Gemmatimonadetes bacterium]|nr:VOC family protein [Gemmatimonadota bacterium]